MSRQTRREFARLTAVSTTTIAGLATLGSVGAARSSQAEWTQVESPTDEPLYGAVETVDGPYAVGGGGDVVARRQDGNWVKVVEYGPQARSRPLFGVDVTDDGRRIWFVGDSGVIGEYDVQTQTLTNYSAPMGITSTWEDCAVRGTAGDNERLYFVNGSGELLVGTRLDSGAVEYEEVIEPGGGSTIPGIDFHARNRGHVVSTSQLVAETEDGGETWEQIGIDFAGEAFFDVASEGLQDVNVAAGAGIIYRYDGFRWTPHVVDSDRQAIRAIDRDDAAGLAAGAEGKVYDRQSVGQWRRTQTPVSVALLGVARTTAVDVAVGENGTIVERTGNAANRRSRPDESQLPTNTADPGVERRIEGEWVAAID
ncbi:hypothetical protein [Halosolutus gelatinilyticus]|uniref:hypothetical protein n=1 Tax=Halosolutus gelatinilyticus TaxID=2931975 RepID=UPI001FF46941|nr:hypothetical protein [Halosolutus gelatinilyticus]